MGKGLGIAGFKEGSLRALVSTMFDGSLPSQSTQYKLEGPYRSQ